MIAPVADGCIAGFGGLGYRLAVEAVAQLLTDPSVTRRDPTSTHVDCARSRVTGRRYRVAGRLDAAASPIRRAVDALLVTTLPNIRYLTGFTGSAGVLVVTPGGALLTTDGRYRTQSAEQLAAAGVAEVEITIGGQAGPARGRRRLPRPASSPVGLEADHVTWSAQRVWAEPARRGRAGAHAGGGRGAARGEGRRRGGPDGAGRGHRRRRPRRRCCPCWCRKGSTEEEFGRRPRPRPCAAAGPRTCAFETIVASGENSAKPHARPGSTRRSGRGDPVVVDFGAIFDGYRSDMTRTFCVGGEPHGELARVFDVVAASQAAGVAAVAPGVAAGEVDEVCRDVIADAGWADRFEHGTGHGVGLDIHEAPSVGPGVDCYPRSRHRRHRRARRLPARPGRGPHRGHRGGDRGRQPTAHPIPEGRAV